MQFENDWINIKLHFLLWCFIDPKEDRE